MINKLYCVYDCVAQEGAMPFMAKNDGVAERLFQDTVNNQLRKLPNVSLEDYALFYLGDFDTEAPAIVANGLETFRRVMNATDVAAYDDILENKNNGQK